MSQKSKLNGLLKRKPPPPPPKKPPPPTSDTATLTASDTLRNLGDIYNQKKMQNNIDNKYVLSLFEYRNISWRYLLCYCLPNQKKILIKQLKIASETTEGNNNNNNNNNNSDGINNKTKNGKHNSNIDDKIPDFYHLLQINQKQLLKLFKQGRKDYNNLRNKYITSTQIKLRDLYMKQTAPPSEYYNDPSLRTRSKTINNLLDRENMHKLSMNNILIIY